MVPFCLIVLTTFKFFKISKVSTTTKSALSTAPTVGDSNLESDLVDEICA